MYITLYFYLKVHYVPFGPLVVKKCMRFSEEHLFDCALALRECADMVCIRWPRELNVLQIEKKIPAN